MRKRERKLVPPTVGKKSEGSLYKREHELDVEGGGQSAKRQKREQGCMNRR